MAPREKNPRSPPERAEEQSLWCEMSRARQLPISDVPEDGRRKYAITLRSAFATSSSPSSFDGQTARGEEKNVKLFRWREQAAHRSNVELGLAYLVALLRFADLANGLASPPKCR